MKGRAKLGWQAGSLRSCLPPEVLRRSRVGTSLILDWVTPLKGPAPIIPPSKHRIRASQIIIKKENPFLSVKHLSVRKIFQRNWTQRTLQALQSLIWVRIPKLRMNLMWSRHSPNPSSQKISRPRNHRCKPVINSLHIKRYWQRHLKHLIILS
jgi:hypothetical protein